MQIVIPFVNDAKLIGSWKERQRERKKIDMKINEEETFRGKDIKAFRKRKRIPC